MSPTPDRNAKDDLCSISGGADGSPREEPDEEEEAKKSPDPEPDLILPIAVITPLHLITTRTIWKNVCCLCLAFLLSFTAFQSIQNLESSISAEANVGTASLSTMYGVFILSCNFAPLVIDRLGTRRTMLLGLVGNVIYTAVHFHSHHYTLIPTSILLGAVAGPMWTAQCTHLIKCAAKYSEMTREKDYIVISQFTGYFYMTFGFTQILGNIVSAAVLEDNSLSIKDTASNSSAALPIINIQRTCGSGDAGESEMDIDKLPTHDSQTLLFTIYTIIGLIAVLALIPLDQLDRIRGPQGARNTSRGCLCASTIQMLKDPKVLLMTPFLMYCGIEQAFLFGDFTKVSN
ncbi:protein unc-93 homolog A-like [Glandiceps talaboti]